MNSDPRYLKDVTVGSSASTIFTMVSVSFMGLSNFSKYSRIAGPMCPVLDPAMLTTLNFFHGNVFYIVRRAKLAWLLLARH